MKKKKKKETVNPERERESVCVCVREVGGGREREGGQAQRLLLSVVAMAQRTNKTNNQPVSQFGLLGICWGIGWFGAIAKTAAKK